MAGRRRCRRRAPRCLPPAMRSQLIADAMRPAETITAWRARAPQGPAALRDVHRIDCASPQEEAGVIAIVMRRTLETPRPHRGPRHVGPRAGAPGRGGASALGDRGRRFGRCAARRDGARRVSQAHRADDCGGGRADPLARGAQAPARGGRHGASGVAPLRQNDGAGNPARTQARAGVWRVGGRR